MIARDFDVGSEKTRDRVGLLLNHLSRGADADEDEGNIQIGDIDDLLEPQLLSLKRRRRRHQAGLRHCPI